MFWFFRKKEIPRELLGCKKEPVDKRDYTIEEVLKAFPPFDWKKEYDVEEELGLKIPIKNQGSSGSCVGQAWSYYAAVLEAFETKVYREQSARWIYSQIYLPGGGAYSRDAGQVLTNQGIVPSVLFPDKRTEEEMRKKDDMTKDLIAVAKVYLKSSYVHIRESYTIDIFASIMKERKGFVGAVFDGFDASWSTPFPKPSGRPEYGHAIYFCKARLFNNEPKIGFPNSWGERIGDKGWQWLGKEWFKTGRIRFPKVVVDLPSEVIRLPEKPKYYFDKDLFYGNRNRDVEMLQRCLAYENCFFYPDFTGAYFGYTARAVRCFVNKHFPKNVASLYDGRKVNSSIRAKLNEIFA